MNASLRAIRAHSPVQIWLLRDEEHVPVSIDSLSPEEVARGKRFRVAAKQRQFWFARDWGRKLLARYLEIAPDEVRWSVSGPPVVSDPQENQQLSVSLSHSGPFLALAISSAPIGLGVDIETNVSELRPLTLAPIVLTEKEQSWLFAAPQNLQAALLRQLWTVKEAALKTFRVDPPPDPRTLSLANLPLTASACAIPDLCRIEFSYGSGQPVWCHSLGGTGNAMFCKTGGISGSVALQFAPDFPSGRKISQIRLETSTEISDVVLQWETRASPESLLTHCHYSVDSLHPG